MVPRSRCKMPSTATAPTTGASGTRRWPRSSRFDHLLVRIAALTATRNSFANSDGCNVIGPMSIHRDAP